MTDSCGTPRRLPGLALITVVGALFIGACSSGTGGSGTTASTGVAGGPAATAHSTSAPTASSATSSVPTNASSTSTAGVGSAAGSGFCKVAAFADAAQRKAASSLAVDSPAALQKFEAQSLANAPAVRRDRPDGDQRRPRGDRRGRPTAVQRPRRRALRHAQHEHRDLRQAGHAAVQEGGPLDHVLPGFGVRNLAEWLIEARRLRRA